jgi:hypothetical protein
LASRACLSVPSAPLDQAIAERLVGAITPVTIELALAQLPKLTADFESAVLTGLDVSPYNCLIGCGGWPDGAKIVTKICGFYHCFY